MVKQTIKTTDAVTGGLITNNRISQSESGLSLPTTLRYEFTYNQEINILDKIQLGIPFFVEDGTATENASASTCGSAGFTITVSNLDKAIVTWNWKL